LWPMGIDACRSSKGGPISTRGELGFEKQGKKDFDAMRCRGNGGNDTSGTEAKKNRQCSDTQFPPNEMKCPSGTGAGKRMGRTGEKKVEPIAF